MDEKAKDQDYMALKLLGDGHTLDGQAIPATTMTLSDPTSDQPILVLGGTGKTGRRIVDRLQAAGAVTVNYGLFINSVVSFLIVAFAIITLIIGWRVGVSGRLFWVAGTVAAAVAATILTSNSASWLRRRPSMRW